MCSNYPVLCTPDWTKQFIMETNTSGYALGVVIAQEFKDGIHPIAFHSRSLLPAEKNYDAHNKELAGVIFGFKCGRCYDPVLHPFIFFFTLLLFQSRDLERHLTFSRDLCHMVDHLTFLSHDHPIVLASSLFYYLDRLLFTFSIVPALLFLTPLFSRPIVRLLRTLSQVAASVVYKPACIVERGLKPDLVSNPSVVAPQTLSVCPSPLPLSHLPLGRL